MASGDWGKAGVADGSDADAEAELEYGQVIAADGKFGKIQRLGGTEQMLGFSTTRYD